MTKIEYKDEKTGEVLYGYSQTSMDNLVNEYRLIKWILAWFLFLAAFGLGMFTYLLWYIVHYKVVTNIVNACI